MLRAAVRDSVSEGDVLFTVRSGWWESVGSTQRVQTRSCDASASENT
ncbi:MAG: hypothetical protein ACKPCM_15105 [Pseudanabaena sp.]